MKQVSPRALVRPALFLLAWLLSIVVPATACAYVEEGSHWPLGQPIVLNLQLGAPFAPLMDGSTSWNQVAEAARSSWNVDLGGGGQLQPGYTAVTPAPHDGVNPGFFAYTVFGEDFGADTLAVTAYFYDHTTHLTNEADVVFNKNTADHSYRGALKMQNGAVSFDDLRRVAIQEFGHVLGRDHVPQDSTSIMTPDVTDIDAIQADDIAGVEALYGNPGPVAPVINGGVIGEDFDGSAQLTVDCHWMLRW